MSIVHQYAVEIDDISEAMHVAEWSDHSRTMDFQGQLVALVDFQYNASENVEYWKVQVNGKETKVWVGREVTTDPPNWVCVSSDPDDKISTVATDPMVAVVRWYFEKLMASDD